MNNFILKKIYNDIKKGFPINKLKFRFAPEPNCVLHLGHVKAIYINFFLSKFFNSKINLRFDDTNPKYEKLIYVNKIIDNIKWLGFKYNKITFTSDYFNILYKLAKNMIINNKAFIQGIFKNKIFKVNDIEENLFIFKNMRIGKYNNNKYVLRANIKNDIPNYHIKYPIMYRIIKNKHYKTKNEWPIYPTYDWAHGQSDYIEKISHSLCSIEFQNHRPLYNWFIDNIYNKNYNIYKPIQIEFSRLNINKVITSKRYLNFLFNNKIIKNYNDPRLLTLNSLKYKGYKSKYIIDFIKKIGFTKRNYNINIDNFNNFIKKKILKITDIILTVFNPVIIIITNYNKKTIKWININNKYKIAFTKYIYIDKNDFKLNHNDTFFRLSYKNYVRLKYSYIIKAYNIKKTNNKIIKIYCKIYNNIDNKKIRSTIQWVSYKYKKKINLYDYDYIYIKNNKF